MRRLLDIIAEDQETILNKDKSILALQNIVQEKKLIIENECKGVSKQEMEKMFLKSLNEKNVEISNIKFGTEFKLCALNVALKEQKKITLEKDSEIDELKSKLETHEALKIQSEELMKIIKKQNSEMKKVKNEIAINEIVLSRNEILQKEVLVLKVAIQQKDLDIKSLTDLLGN